MLLKQRSWQPSPTGRPATGKRAHTLSHRSRRKAPAQCGADHGGYEQPNPCGKVGTTGRFRKRPELVLDFEGIWEVIEHDVK